MTSQRAPLRRSRSLPRTQSLDDLARPPSLSQYRSERRLTENRDFNEASTDPVPHHLCATCMGINAESMASDGGYNHLFLEELEKSKSTCRMCLLIHSKIGRNVNGYTRGRYRIRLSFKAWRLEPPDFDKDHRPSSNLLFHDNREFSKAWIAEMDLRPWESLDGSMNQPDRHPKPSPVEVRGEEILCFTEEHDPSRKFGLAWVRNIGASTASSTSLNIAKSWLDKCLNSEHHLPPDIEFPWSDAFLSPRKEDNPHSEILSETFPRDRPAHLIQISEPDLGDIIIHLINTEDKQYRYAALSYCWGKQSQKEGQKWQLTESNSGPHHQNIGMNTLPRTVRDSILIAWKLGISYIWVDALCIVQDSPSHWAQEAAKMGGIYFGSLVTIAASAVTSAEDGCFNSSSMRTTEIKEFKNLISIKSHFQDGQGTSMYFLDSFAKIPDVYEAEVINGPLSKRAWTYQEFVLPRRTLYFTSKQLLWECTHCRLSEDNFPQTQLRRPFPILDFEWILGSDNITYWWHWDAVPQYSQRQITFEKDKLVAISALARAAYYNTPTNYIAGLWEETLLHGMEWCRASEGYKSTSFPCPSWSWASQNSAVTYSSGKFPNPNERGSTWPTREDLKDEDKCTDESYTYPEPRIINVHWKADPINPFGNVSDAYIDLHTKVSIGIVLRDYFDRPGNADVLPSQGLMVPYSPQTGNTEWRQVPAMMDDSGRRGGKVFIAFLGVNGFSDICFLLLDPPDLNATTFRRVGIAYLHAYDAPFLAYRITNNWMEKEIRLV